MFIHAHIIGTPTTKTQGIPISEDARLTYMENLSDRILSALTEIGKNQSELARFVGVRSPSVNDWISGKTKTIKGQNLLRAAEFLKVNPQWLAEGRGPKEPFSFQALKKAQEESDEDFFHPSEIDYVIQDKHEGSSYVVSVKYDKAPESVKSTIDDLLSLPADQAEEIAATIQKLKGIYGSGGKT